MIGRGEMDCENGGIRGVRIIVMYHYNQNLFRRYARNVWERRVTDHQLANSNALLVSTGLFDKSSALGY